MRSTASYELHLQSFYFFGLANKCQGCNVHLPTAECAENNKTEKRMNMKLTTGAILTIAIFAANATFAADGKALYEQHCVKCHGADGKGETKMGKKMEAKDYSNAKAWEGLTDAKAIKSVKEGFKDKEGKVIMKPTEGVTDDDAKAIIEYMKTLKK